MCSHSYIIAGHGVVVDFVNEADSVLLPSAEPFRTDAVEAPVLRMVVDDGYQFEPWSEEVGVFDCGGADYGVYRMADGGYLYEVHDVDGTLCSRLRTDSDFTHGIVALTVEGARLRGYGLNNTFMLMFAFASAPHGTLLMHSSVIRWGGRGYMFLGKSGTGKSTHTSLWRRYIPGSDLMNDDNPVLRVIDGKAYVYGSPWSGKTPCYRNVSAPVGGIVQLKQKPENTISREGVLGALSILLPSASTMKWDHRIHNAIINTMSAVIGCTPIYTLGCRPDEEAAQLSHRTLCHRS